MTNSGATQLSLIAESDFTHRPIGDWEYDELGTDIFLVPNFPEKKLGTEISDFPNFPEKKLGTEILLVPNFPDQKLGTEISDFPNSYNWQPPIGCLEQKPIKNRHYWYWRYYDNRGKKASLYLARDYNKSVARAIHIGIPPNAKQIQVALQSTNPQTSTPTRPAVGVNLTLHQAIDYDRLTPTQQARWDAGMYGSIELKSRGIYHYYYLRWLDPTNGKYRSTYLGKDWDVAVAKLKLLTNPVYM